jgi:hypothetical protein
MRKQVVNHICICAVGGWRQGQSWTKTCCTVLGCSRRQQMKTAQSQRPLGPLRRSPVFSLDGDTGWWTRSCPGPTESLCAPASVQAPGLSPAPELRGAPFCRGRVHRGRPGGARCGSGGALLAVLRPPPPALPVRIGRYCPCVGKLNKQASALFEMSNPFGMACRYPWQAKIRDLLVCSRGGLS